MSEQDYSNEPDLDVDGPGVVFVGESIDGPVIEIDSINEDVDD